MASYTKTTVLNVNMSSNTQAICPLKPTQVFVPSLIRCHTAAQITHTEDGTCVFMLGVCLRHGSDDLDLQHGRRGLRSQTLMWSCQDPWRRMREDGVYHIWCRGAPSCSEHYSVLFLLIVVFPTLPYSPPPVSG